MNPIVVRNKVDLNRPLTALIGLTFSNTELSLQPKLIGGLLHLKPKANPAYDTVRAEDYVGTQLERVGVVDHLPGISEEAVARFSFTNRPG